MATRLAFSNCAVGTEHLADQNSGRPVRSEKIRGRRRDEVDPQPFQHIMTGELDGQVTSEAIGALGYDRPDLQGEDQPVRYLEVQRKAESAEALAAAADASLGHCRAGRLFPWTITGVVLVLVIVDIALMWVLF